MRYSSKQSLRGYDKAALGSITPTLSGVVVSDPRLPHEMKEESNFEIRVGFNQNVSPGRIMNQGDNMTEDQNISIGIGGEGVSSHQFQVIVDGQAIQPAASPLYYTLQWSVSQGLPSEGTAIVMVDGTLWGSVYFEGARP